MIYAHRQIGTTIVAVLALAAIGLALLMASIPGARIGAGIAFVVLAVAGLSFATLTIEVDDREVRWRFGPLPLVSGVMPLNEIAATTAVHLPWYYGLGVRRTPDGPLYCVSGTSAVELRRSDGSRVRLGTDEAQLLLKAIEQARRSAR